MLIFGLAFLLFGSIFPVVFGWGLPVDLAIAVSGTTVQGKGLDARVNRSVRINRAHPTIVRFSYEMEGQRYTGEVSTFDDAAIAAGNSGGSLSVEVARLNPSWARVEGTTNAAFGYIGLFTLIFPLVGLAMFAGAVRSNRREVAAFTHGVPTRATVVYSGPDTTTKINGRHPRIVRWRFELDGREYTGSLSGFELGSLEALVEGEEVPVLYLPENPSINTLYVD